MGSTRGPRGSPARPLGDSIGGAPAQLVPPVPHAAAPLRSRHFCSPPPPPTPRTPHATVPAPPHRPAWHPTRLPTRRYRIPLGKVWHWHTAYVACAYLLCCGWLWVVARFA